MKSKRLLAVLLSLCLTAGTPMQAFAAQDSVINLETTETFAEEATAAAVTETVAEVVSEEAAEPEAEETALETEASTERVSTEEAVTSSPESSVTEEKVNTFLELKVLVITVVN